MSEKRKQAAARIVAYLLRWLAVALMAGVVGSVVVAGFSWIVEHVWRLGSALGWPLRLCLPIAAGLVVGLLIYRFLPEAGGASLPLYVSSVHDRGGFVPQGVVVGKYFAATINLGCGISGGSFGPVMLTGAGLCAWMAEGLRGRLARWGFHKHDFQQVAICGAAGAAGALSGCPLAGGLLAAEILYPANIRYRHMLPGIMAAVVGHAVHGLYVERIGVHNLAWAVKQVMPQAAGALSMSWPLAGAVAALVATCVLAGGGFAAFYRGTMRLCDRLGRWRLFAPAMGAAAAALVALVVGSFAGQKWGVLTMGLGRDESLEAALGPVMQQGIWWAILMLAAGKVLSTGLAVGSGNASGLVLPVLLVGALLGKVVAVLMGIATPTESVALVAAGMASMLAVALNVPLAAAVLAVELFGVQCGPIVAAAAVLAFLIGRPVALLDYLEHRAQGDDLM